MVAASRAKTSDRAAILKKLLPAIKKQYKVAVPKHDRPVLETMLFAICLEDTSVDEAEKSYAKLFVEFPDLNEIRVYRPPHISPRMSSQGSVLMLCPTPTLSAQPDPLPIR